MQRLLENKKVLFISTKYHNYEEEVLIGLKRVGALVDFYYDDPLDYLSFISPKIVQQIVNLSWQKKMNERFRKYLIKKASKENYDYVFILKGSILTIPFLSSLKQLQPEAKFIQYQWDSLANYNYLSFLPFFDYNFSFDHSDALKIEELQYLPMFARDDFYQLSENRKNVKQDIDLLFVGANHSNRMVLLRKLREILRRYSLSYKFYVYLPFLIGLKGVFISRKLNYEELMLRSISKKRLKKLLIRSRYVLDLPSPNQSGVTPRALEALASGCKLITSDKGIQNLPIYDADFISVIELNELNSIPKIMTAELSHGNHPDVRLYSSTNWIKTIFLFSEYIASESQPFESR